MRRSRIAIAFAAVTCALAPVAYMAMFTGFREYDDEGYFLVTLRDYVSGQALYTQVPTIYGPFFYESMGAVFRLLGLAPGHDSGRFVTLAVWLIASLVGGLAAHWLTRSLWLGLAAQLVTFIVLVPLIDEPMHPSGLVSLLLMCLVSAAALRPARPRATAVVVGGIVGGLCLVKINVGAFAAIAVAFAFACRLEPRYRRLLLPLMALIVAALPPVLMAGMLSQAWVFEYASVVALSGAALGIACVISPPKSMAAPSGAWLAAGGAAVVIACSGIALATGSSVIDLFNGPLAGAARLPQVFVVPLNFGGGFVWAAVAIAAALAAFGWRVKRGVPSSVVGMLRVGVGFLMWMALLRLPSPVFLMTLILAWVATRPPRDEVDDPVGGYARVLLPALAVLESLQAYPVAGTQLSLASLGLMPVGAIIISDGVRQLRRAGLEARQPLRRQGFWIAPATLLVSVAAFLYLAFYTTAGFLSVTSLGLPGAASVRVPTAQRSILQSVVAAIDRDCSSLITLPGMNSFYFWTGQGSPAQLYPGTARILEKEVWMYELDSGTQQAVVQQLSNQQGLCVVKDQAVIDFWARSRHGPTGPLIDFIDQGFVSGGTFGDYELLIRR